MTLWFLDLATLIVVTIFVTILLGGLLFYTWAQDRRSDALAWWSGGQLTAAIGAFLFLGRGQIPDILSITIANSVMLFAYAMLWTGARRFEHRPVWWPGLSAGAVLWALACLIPAFYASAAARLAFCSGAITIYTLAFVAEIWRGRRERLALRYPTLFVLLAHAAVYVARTIASLWTGDAVAEVLYHPAWAVGLSFEALLIMVLLSFLSLGLTKERLEREQRLMAGTDALTGALNRRALFQKGKRRLARDLAGGRPAALLLLDIDHFKQVNDRHGHSTGDRVLCRLADIVRARLPDGAYFARLGGEEFTCLLPDRTRTEALAFAEQIRTAFADATLEPALPQLRATISIGLADTDEAGHELETLLAAADAKLYRAKRAGRDRVEHLAVVAKAA